MYSFIAAILSFFTWTATATAATSIQGDPVVQTQANPQINSSVTFEGPWGNATITTVLDRLIDYAILIASPIAAVMILWGAFQILTSRGIEKQYLAGRQTIIYALGGLAVVVLARGLVALFRGLIDGLV